MTTPFLRGLVLGAVSLLALAATSFGFTGKITDQDAGGGYITVTNPDDQTSTTFKVTADTVILNPDGSPTDLLHLIETTIVQVDSAGGDGNVATKITILPAPQQQVP